MIISDHTSASNKRYAKKNWLFPIGPFTFYYSTFFGSFEGLSDQGLQAVLATTFGLLFGGLQRLSQLQLQLYFPLYLFPLTGGMESSTTTAAFGHKYVFLYLGGFLIAIGIEKWNLHRRIALNIIAFIGSDVRKVILGFMLATAFLSMWISNTATSVMMLPIGIAIIKQLKDNPATDEDENQVLGKP